MQQMQMLHLNVLTKHQHFGEEKNVKLCLVSEEENSNKESKDLWFGKSNLRTKPVEFAAVNRLTCSVIKTEKTPSISCHYHKGDGRGERSRDEEEKCRVGRGMEGKIGRRKVGWKAGVNETIRPNKVWSGG